MGKNDLIKYCKYYKGEKECPFVTGTNQGLFWDIERMYIENILSDDNDTFRMSWEGRAQLYAEEHPKAKNVFTDKNVSIHTKGIARYISEMVAKWNPYQSDILKDY